MTLDHTILRISDPLESERFYRQIPRFEHEGRVGLFVIRLK